MRRVNDSVAGSNPARYTNKCVCSSEEEQLSLKQRVGISKFPRRTKYSDVDERFSHHPDKMGTKVQRGFKSLHHYKTFHAKLA